MSVTIRPYINGGWEADIRVVLPDGTVIRERKKAPGTKLQEPEKIQNSSSKSGWA